MRMTEKDRTRRCAFGRSCLGGGRSSSLGGRVASCGLILSSLLRVHVVSGSWRDLGLLLPRRRVLKAVSGSFCSSKSAEGQESTD